MSCCSSWILYILLLYVKLCRAAQQTLTNLSGRITYTVTAPNDQAQWLIATSSSAKNIQVIFESLNIEQAELRIYEAGSNTQLYSCVSCGVLLPPPFFSKTGSITVSVTGSAAISFRQSTFAMQYVCTPVAVTQSLKSVSINLNMAYAKIYPVLANGMLPAGSNQQWLIKQPAGTALQFSLVNFNFGNTCDARLTIYDQLTPGAGSNVIFSGCRQSDAPDYWLYSRTGTASVVLTANGSDVPGLDFQLTYYADNDLYSCGSFLRPDALSDASMVLSDGSASARLMRTSAQCSWRIAPLDGSSVNLIFQWVSLKYGSSVVVYDGPVAAGTVLWRGSGATTTVPPILYSTGGSLFVAYQSDASNTVSYYGFAGAYYSNSAHSVGAGSGSSLLAMSSAIDLHPPGDARSYSSAERGANYTWNVVPASTKGVITFAFSELNLPHPGDRLTLYDGPIASARLLGTFSGSSLPTQWFSSTGASATLVFQTRGGLNATAPRGNFKLSYYADGPNYHCGFSTNPATVTAPSMILTDGSSSVESMYSQQLCQWNVAPPGGALAVYVFFTRFSTSGATLDLYTGTVASGRLFASIADVTVVPAPILLPASSIGVAFKTRNSPSGYGFSLTYFGVSPAVESSTAGRYSFPGDGVIRLHCSSMLSLVLALADSADSTKTTNNSIPPFIPSSTNLTWLIAPAVSSGRLYLAFTHLRLPDCSRGYLDVHDGVSFSAPLLGRFCGDNSPGSGLVPYSWVQTSSTAALLNFVSSRSAATEGNFEVSFYSDGPNYHCGFAVNPARVTAPSMVFTDGSSSTEAMFSGQHCEWLIEPQVERAAAPVDVVLEFLQCDLRGGSIHIYAGTSNTSSLLWSCKDCSAIPRPIISTATSLLVVYKTATTAPVFGSGFQAVYWTVNSTTWRHSGSGAAVVADSGEAGGLEGQVLELPEGLTMAPSVHNSTASFHLPTSTVRSSLRYYPTYTVAAASEDIGAVNDAAIDGRSASQLMFKSLTSPNNICGVVNSRGGSYLRHPNSLHYASTQRAESYVHSSASYKSLLQLRGLQEVSESAPASALFSSPGVCKYHLDSGSAQAVSIQLKSLSLRSSLGRLRIYGGLLGTDALLFDSNWMRAADSSHPLSLSHNLTAPCGRATILLEANTSSTDTGGELPVDGETPLADYSLDLTYQAVDSDAGGAICEAYIQSLLPPVEKEDPFIPYYIAAAGAALLIGMCVALFYANKRQKKFGYVFFPDVSRKQRKYLRITPNHPRYSRHWDGIRNRFLPKGHCCVCKSDAPRVFFLRCTHAVCVEDMQGYLEAALGDISQFPVKCPMHYEGCTGVVDARLAKRIFTEHQYGKFLEFSDRAIYGDGMRCIFCNNFVNFPDNMANLSRVECPYCVQLFCVRCKKPWHFETRCPAEKFDDSLEVWKLASGAQKCPACRKIIEKDDPDTCHHMCHKITDGVPCVRDRTDFCYLCGEEVAPNYPHDEVRNPGVNHFPQGVFQKCRRVLIREKEEEREKLKRIRRMKAKNPVKMATIVPVDSEAWRGSGSERLPPRVLPPIVHPECVPGPGTPPQAGPRSSRNNGGGGTTPLLVRALADSSSTSSFVTLADRFDAQWDRALLDSPALNGRTFARHRLESADTLPPGSDL